MDFIKNTALFFNPFAPAAVYIFSIIFLIFFGLSARKGLKVFAYILSLASVFASGFLLLHGFLKSGVYSDNLFTSGIMEVVEVIVLFALAMVLSTALFIFAGKFESFIRITIILQTAVLAAYFIIISKSFLSFSVSLTSFIILIFSLSALLNTEKESWPSGKSVPAKIVKGAFSYQSAIVRFFSVSLIFIIISFFGFSLLYGISDFRNFQQLAEGLNSGDFNILIIFIIFAISYYFYFGFFPFQAPYYNYSVKAEISSNYLIWLLYLPVGLISVFKFAPAAAIIFKDRSDSLIYVFSAIILAAMAGSAATLFKSGNLRKISAGFITLITVKVIISLSMYIFKIISYQQFIWLNLANTAYMLLSFMPVVYLFSLFENNFLKTNSVNFKKAVLKNKFLSVSFIIYILSIIGIPGLQGFLGKKELIETAFNIFKGNYYNLNPATAWIFFALIIIYMIIIAAAAARLAAMMFSRNNNSDDKNEVVASKTSFPKSVYILNGVCIGIIVITGIIGLIEIIAPGSLFSVFTIESAEIFSDIIK